MKNLIIFTGTHAPQAVKLFSQNFGPSFFTTMRSAGKNIYLWPRHYARLKDHAQYFGFNIPSQETLTDLIYKNLPTNRPEQKIRILVAKKYLGLSFEDLILPDKKIYHGVDICLINLTIKPSSVKSTNRKIYDDALFQAQTKNIFEALLSDQNNNIIDGSRTSLLLYDGKQTFIEPKGGLDSVMRAHVTDYLRGQKFVIRKAYIKTHELTKHMILCNSIIGVVPVYNISHPVIGMLVGKFRPPAL